MSYCLDNTILLDSPRPVRNWIITPNESVTLQTYNTLSHEPDLSFLAQYSSQNVYLSMLFFLSPNYFADIAGWLNNE